MTKPRSRSARALAMVLVAAVVDLLRPVGAGLVVDATFGGGGHSRALLEALPGIRVLAVDRDPDAAANARLRLL